MPWINITVDIIRTNWKKLQFVPSKDRLLAQNETSLILTIFCSTVKHDNYYNRTSCSDEIEFITKDYFSKHTNITTVYKDN